MCYGMRRDWGHRPASRLSAMAPVLSSRQLSQHLTRAEYAAFRGRDLHSSAGYVTLKRLSDQYLVDHEDELAEIAETDLVADLLGVGFQKVVSRRRFFTAAARTTCRRYVSAILYRYVVAIFFLLICTYICIFAYLSRLLVDRRVCDGEH